MICLMMATFLEAEPFILKMRMQKKQKTSFPLYVGRDTILVISGVGKVQAAMAATYACLSLRPEIILNLGAAGANSQHAQPGEIYHIDKVLEMDRLYFKTGEPFMFLPDTLATVQELQQATLLTRDIAVVDAGERAQLAQYGELSDMEGAAIVQVCKKIKTPCSLFKQVTDTCEQQQINEIAANIKKHRDALFACYTEVIHPRLLQKKHISLQGKLR